MIKFLVRIFGRATGHGYIHSRPLIRTEHYPAYVSRAQGGGNIVPSITIVR
jgi:hypothetical protein